MYNYSNRCVNVTQSLGLCWGGDAKGEYMSARLIFQWRGVLTRLWLEAYCRTQVFSFFSIHTCLCLFFLFLSPGFVLGNKKKLTIICAFTGHPFLSFPFPITFYTRLPSGTNLSSVFLWAPSQNKWRFFLLGFISFRRFKKNWREK